MKWKKGTASLFLAAALAGSVYPVDASWLSGVLSKIEQKVDEYGSGQKVVREEFRFSQRGKTYYDHKSQFTTTKGGEEELAAERTFTLDSPAFLALSYSSPRGNYPITPEHPFGSEIVVSHSIYDGKGKLYAGPYKHLPVDHMYVVLEKGKYTFKTYVKAPGSGYSGEYTLSANCYEIEANAPQDIGSFSKAMDISLGQEIVNFFPSNSLKNKDAKHYYRLTIEQGMNVQFEMDAITWISCPVFLLDSQGQEIAKVDDPFDAQYLSKTNVYLAAGTYYVRAGDGGPCAYSFKISPAY